MWNNYLSRYLLLTVFNGHILRGRTSKNPWGSFKSPVDISTLTDFIGPEVVCNVCILPALCA